MATVSGKKGKKVKKNNKLSLGEFLTDGNTAVLNQVQISVPVKLSDWGEDGDDDDDDRGVRTQVIALPTAPRATRILNDDSIPQHPPFSIYVSNLPYDINEEDLYEIFGDQEIVMMSLPRDDGDSRRLRGFGNIEFATRDDLMDVLAMPEPMVRNRRIRIGLFNENDTKRRNNRYDNFSSSGDGDRPSSGNWRDRPDRGGGGGGSGERDRDGGGMRRNYNSGYNRDREERPGSDGSGGGNWRTDNRPPLPPPLSPGASRRNYDRERPGERGDGGFRRMPDSRMARPPRDPEVPMERPKLVLQPRTLPLPEQPKPRPESDDDSRESEGGSGADGSGDSMPSPPRPRPTPVPAAKVFGDAKPVDTAAREREIEERLREKERLEREERQRKKETEAAAAAEAAATAAVAADKDNAQQESEKENIDTENKGTAPPAEEAVVNWRVRKPNEDDSSNKDDRRTDNHRDSNRGSNRSLQSNGVVTDREYQRDQGRDRAPPPARDGARVADAKDKPTKSTLEKERERDPKVLEERMPKFQEPSGPNLSMKNTFEGLSADEIDD